MATSFSISYDFLINNNGLLRGIDKISEGVKRLNSSFENLGKTTSRLTDPFDRMGDRFEKIAKKATLFMALPAGFLTRSLIKEAISLEQLQIRFNAFFGEEAPKALQFAKKYANETAFSLNEVVDLATVFKARQEKLGLTNAGIEVAVRGAGDVFLARARSEYEREGAVRALRQVIDAGRLMGQEVNQFMNAGVDIINMLEKNTNINGQQIRKMMAEGKINSQIVLQSLLQESKNPIIRKILDERAKGLSGQADQLSGILQTFKGTLGLVLSQGLNLPKLFSNMSNGIQSLTASLEKMDPLGKKFVSWALLSTIAIPAFIVGVWGMIRVFSFLVTGIVALRAAMFALGNTMLLLRLRLFLLELGIGGYIKSIFKAIAATKLLQGAMNLLGNNPIIKVGLTIGSLLLSRDDIQEKISSKLGIDIGWEEKERKKKMEEEEKARVEKETVQKETNINLNINNNTKIDSKGNQTSDVTVQSDNEDAPIRALINSLNNQVSFAY